MEGGGDPVRDRMNFYAQNALPQDLEEPPPNCLLNLVTDAPAALLATSRSAPQFVEVGGGRTRRRDAVAGDLWSCCGIRGGRATERWPGDRDAPRRSLEEMARRKKPPGKWTLRARAKATRGTDESRQWGWW
jgi:hypothetical protein